MKASLGKLLQEGLVEEIGPAPGLAKQAIASAEKDLATARAVLKIGNFDWAYAIAYNAMLQAGRALLFRSGYRSRPEHGHVAVVRFCAERLGKKSGVLVELFNKMRVRRHKVVYEQRETVSEGEAKRAIENAAEMLLAVKTEL